MTYDSREIKRILDKEAEGDLKMAIKAGLVPCCMCDHYFDPVTLLPSEKFKHVIVLKNKGDGVCSPCRDKWPAR